MVSRTPGSIPAAKSLPMDTSASTPYTIIRILGGISGEFVEKLGSDLKY